MSRPLGKGGKLFWKRGRMNNTLFDNPKSECYAVPAVWEKPDGFHYDYYTCWTTKSEIIALNHYRTYAYAQNKLKSKFDKIIEKQDELYALSKAVDCDVKLPDGIKKEFVPRPHQLVAIKYGQLTNGCFILADQQRVGKSFAFLMYVMTQKWDKVLIVAPSKVCPIWVKMVSVISDIPTKVLRTNDALESGKINICSYDTLHTIADLSCCIAGADECHFFLTDNARRSQAVYRISAEKRIAMSATPTLNKVTDILSILKWVKPDLCEEIRILIQGISNLDAYEQARIVSEELKRKILLLRETHQVGTAIQPYVNYIDIPGELKNPKDIQEIGRVKAMYALEYIKSFDHSIVVVFHHTATGNQLKARLGNDCVLINGETPKEEVQESLEKFKNGKVRIMLGSSVLGEGIDLSGCSHLLIVEESHVSFRADQVRERCNSLYKQEEVLIDILRLKDSRDDRVYHLLDKKYAISQGFRDA